MLAAGCPKELSQTHKPQVQPTTSSTPASAADEKEEPVPSLQIGLAQFFTETDARTHRRDKRAYTATKVLAEGARPSQEGYDLVITGRLRRLKNGAVITCTNRASDLPPDCVISAEFDTVAIEDPITGETIATWSSA